MSKSALSHLLFGLLLEEVTDTFQSLKMSMKHQPFTNFTSCVTVAEMTCYLESGAMEGVVCHVLETGELYIDGQLLTH